MTRATDQRIVPCTTVNPIRRIRAGDDVVLTRSLHVNTTIDELTICQSRFDAKVVKGKQINRMTTVGVVGIEVGDAKLVCLFNNRGIIYPGKYKGQSTPFPCQGEMIGVTQQLGGLNSIHISR